MSAIQQTQELQTNVNVTGVCPLCFETFPRGELHNHIAAERREIVEYTAKMIKAVYRKWREEDGACERCWDFYEELGRFVSTPTTKPQTDLRVVARRFATQGATVS
jgi:hypothetical protein